MSRAASRKRPARAAPRPRRRRRAGGAARVAEAMAWLVVLLGALSLVVWRQTRGVELERLLSEAETARALATAERLDAIQQIQELSSRERVVRIARDRLGMHLPTDREIVFIAVPPAAAPAVAADRR